MASLVYSHGKEATKTIFYIERYTHDTTKKVKAKN